jgi:hypothetical protein
MSSPRFSRTLISANKFHIIVCLCFGLEKREGPNLVAFDKDRFDFVAEPAVALSGKLLASQTEDFQLP